MPDAAFKRFGKYEIQAELGRGGFGRVFRAFDPTVGRLVAIKVLTSEAGSDMLTRFRNEAMAAGNLRHENIVTIYEFGQENGVPFIAMEYLEGEDLQQVIRAGRKLTLLEKDPNNGSNRRRTGMRAPLVAEARTDQAQGDLVLE